MVTKGSLFKQGNNWYYRYMYNGVRICKKGTTDKSETRSLMLQSIAETERSGKVFIPADMTVSNLLDIWYDECVKDVLRHGTRCDYLNAINNHIKPILGDKKLKDVTIDDLQQYLDGKQKKYAPSTLKAHLVVLNGAFRYAVYPKKYIKDNPMLYVQRKKINRNLDTFLDFEDDSKIKIIDSVTFQKILSVNTEPMYYMTLLISYHTGARAGEVCGLSWEDIDFTNMTMRINKSMFFNTELKRWELGKTKGGKPRTVDFGKTLLDILKLERKRQLESKMYYGVYYKNMYYDVEEIDGIKHFKMIDDTEKTENSTPIDFVCKKDGSELFTNQTVKYLVKKTKKALDIEFNFHMLRHTHATILVENGAIMKDVQERLGHTDIRITMNTYSHVTPKMKKQTVDIFEKPLY